MTMKVQAIPQTIKEKDPRDGKIKDKDLSFRLKREGDYLVIVPDYEFRNPCRFTNPESSELCLVHVTQILEEKYEKYGISHNYFTQETCEKQSDKNNFSWECSKDNTVIVPDPERFSIDVINIHSILRETNRNICCQIETYVR